MEELGLAGLPVVESSVAYHIHPNRHSLVASSSIFLPTKMEHVTVAIFQTMYKYGRQRCVLLMRQLCYLPTKILEEMGCQLDTGLANPAAWDEICVFNDLILRSSLLQVRGPRG